MTAVKINAFGGMIPATDDRLLPDQAAALSENTWAYHGDLVGITTPKYVRDVSATTKKSFRVPNDYYDTSDFTAATWMDFDDANTDVVRSPVVGDTFDRYYWVSPTESPKVNSLARIVAASGAYKLGIPAPATAPTAVVTGGTSAIVVSRAYVVTWVSAFGEEGQPSPALLRSEKQDATWELQLPVVPAGYVADYNLDKARIYRTVTAVDGTATYYFVAEEAIAALAHTDSLDDQTVSGNAIIQSTDWAPPPTDLEGWVTMPNGMIAGWRESEVWFCEPYRPHAWPAKYAVAVEYPVIGLGVTNQTLVICTAGYPVVATGLNPSSISLSKIASFEPCLSRGSIVSAPEGVYYASPNGIVLVANGIASNVSEGLLLKDSWTTRGTPHTLRATRLGNGFYGWAQNGTTGFVADLTNQRIAFNVLSNATATANVFGDAWSNDPILIRGSKLYRLDLSDAAAARDAFTWRSKIFQLPYKKNFEALRLYFEPAPVIGNSIGNVSVYADGNLVVTRSLITSGALLRLPSGFKADFWQVEITSTGRIYSFQMATSAKELVKV